MSGLHPSSGKAERNRPLSRTSRSLPFAASLPRLFLVTGVLGGKATYCTGDLTALAQDFVGYATGAGFLREELYLRRSICSNLEYCKTLQLVMLSIRAKLKELYTNAAASVKRLDFQ